MPNAWRQRWQASSRRWIELPRSAFGAFYLAVIGTTWGASVSAAMLLRYWCRCRDPTNEALERGSPTARLVWLAFPRLGRGSTLS